jgi:hypothetical protein
VIGRASLNAGAGGLGNGAVMTISAFVGAQCPPGPGQPACQRAARRGLGTVVFVRAAPGPAGSAALARYVHRYRDLTSRPGKPTVLVNFGESVNFPLLFGVALSLFGAAIINLFTKQAATISGVAFTLVFYGLFVASERATRKSHAGAATHLDEFQLLPSPDINAKLVGARPGNVLVPVRDYNTLTHLDVVLGEGKHEDVVVMTVRLLAGPDAGVRDLDVQSMFTDYEQLLFTKVVALAERHGRPVRLLIAPGGNVFDAIAQTAVQLKSSEIALGESAKMPAREQVRLLGEAWERTPRDRQLQMSAIVYQANGQRDVFHLGVHAPDLSPDDLERVHRLWLDCVRASSPHLHHRDIVAVALEDFEDRLSGPDRDMLLTRLRTQTTERNRRSA